MMQNQEDFKKKQQLRNKEEFHFLDKRGHKIQPFFFRKFHKPDTIS